MCWQEQAFCARYMLATKTRTDTNNTLDTPGMNHLYIPAAQCKLAPALSNIQKARKGC